MRPAPSSPDHARRIVVKIGSAVLAAEGELDSPSVQRIASDISSVLTSGTRVVIVSSGAVASGFRALGLTRPPRTIIDKQAAAAVGQPLLMSAWAHAFSTATTEPVRVAQVLLTADDLDNRHRFLNARHTLGALLDAGIVPIINENDSVSYAEIKLGDNDHLSALVAGLVGADLLLILSSVPGLLERGTGHVIPVVNDPEAAIAHVTADKTGTGVGGMATKLRAAAAARRMGIATVIADGRQPGIIARVLAGEPAGTSFPPRTGLRARSRDKWIGFSARARGVLTIDDGARRAILQSGASLLPSGITAVQGDFDRGALVEVRADRAAIARGVVNYDSTEIARLRGVKTAQIASTLGYHYADEVIHRSDMVILSDP